MRPAFEQIVIGIGKAIGAVQSWLEVIGIGFIGAGSILHMRGLTTGLTTAATLFVVASVGMATGGGLFLTAFFATVVIVVALIALGHLEQTFSLKLLMMTYEATGSSVEQVSQEVNRILERAHRMMLNVLSGYTGALAGSV